MDKETVQQLMGSIPFLERNGLEVVDVKERYLKAKMKFEGNGNHFGVMYAGAIYTIAESLGGGLFWTIFDVTKYYPLIEKTDIRYLKPAKSDVFLEISFTKEEVERIQKELETKGVSKFILNMQIKDNNGQIVAEYIGYYSGRSFNRPKL